MIGFLGLLVCMGAAGIVAVRDSIEDDNRRISNSQNGFDTYIDTKGVQRSTKTGRVAIDLRNANGDMCLTDLKTGQIYRNYDAEKREKLKQKIKELNNDEDFVAMNKKYIEQSKIDYMSIWVEDPDAIGGTKIIHVRKSDGLRVKRMGFIGAVHTYDYEIFLQASYVAHLQDPKMTYDSILYKIKENKRMIEKFNPLKNNPLGFKTKEEFAEWAKEIGGAFELEDIYIKQFGIQIPEFDEWGRVICPK